MARSKFCHGFRRYATGVCFLSATLCAQGLKPTATPNRAGSISGTVLDEADLPVEALVTIATQGLRQQTSTPPDGTYLFNNLKPGIYVVCAQPKLTAEALVDSCLWQDNSSLKVALAPGQARNATVPVQHGYLLKIRVNDPHGLLPPTAGPISGNALSVYISGPSKLIQIVPITAQDKGGRDHTIVIPYDTPYKIVVHSTSVALKDGNGKEIDHATPFMVTATHGVPLGGLVINVDRRKP
jgi:hypothetical protein